MTKAPKLRESRVVLFGKPNELQDSTKKITCSGRKVEYTPRPSFDTGLGQCGKHLCSCKNFCGEAYEGDKAPTMGAGF